MQPAATDSRASGADPEKATPRSRSGFLDFAHSHCLRRTEKTAERLAAARSDPTASAVHDLRVAARRLVYTLDCFSVLLDADRAADFRKRVKSLLSAARLVRELDVALELVSKLDSGLQHSIADDLRRRRDTAARLMSERLERKGVQKLTRRWLSTASGAAPEPAKETPEATKAGGRWYSHLPWMPEQSCAANASAVLPSLAADYFRQGRAACIEGTPPDELHAFRLASKRLRYCLELFSEQYGPSLATRLESLRDIQGRLGALSDYDSTIRLLDSAEAPSDSASLRLLTILSDGQGDATESFLKSWKRNLDTPNVEDDWKTYLTLPQE
ncbi:MAG: CHAD domain-containing protein [Acidobacteriia bacterium]|nr:CHAD domain-containing protein [Terriglobia bacterium]MYG01130.1 CHAD domain-containing protein [Terriglobia bacterium]MYK10634.1 CHAD domain-containing protein [Terriglobia bacterium]